jgi:hypothetical protein
MGTSWRVLRNDGLVMFPLTLGVSQLVVIFYVLLAFKYGGTFDRLGGGLNVLPADFIFLGLAYLGGVFLVAYFSAALIAAVHYRIAGGTPDFRFGLEAANDRLGAIALWAVIAGTAGFFFRRLGVGASARSGDLFGALTHGAATSLVTPVMMVEGSPPLDAMRRAGEMFRETWGRQLVGNFGFAPIYLGLLAVSIILAGGLYGIGVSSGYAVISGLVPFTLAAATLKCLDAVFTAALYNYAAVGETDGPFAEDVLRGAYVVKNARGRFGRPPSRRRAAA